MICAISLIIATIATLAATSSHSEAPGTSKHPRTDISDFYMFMATNESVAFVLNASPLQRSDGGPNYAPTDTNHVYELHIDNNGDATEDITFQFLVGQRFGSSNGVQNSGVKLNVGGISQDIALVVFDNVNVTTAGASATVNLFQTGLNSLEYYRVRLLLGDDYERPLDAGPFLSSFSHPSSTVFIKAFENVGNKTFPGDAYNAYVQNFIYEPNNSAVFANGLIASDGVRIPGCSEPASVFVGPRRDPFSIYLGAVFDLINVPGAPVEQLLTDNSTFTFQNFEFNTLDCNSVLSFVLQVDKSCLVREGNPVLGAWTTVRTIEHDTRNYAPIHVTGEQVSRLGNPLVNELFIGLPDKDRWSSAQPRDDSQFDSYLKYPTLPAIIEILFNVTAPFINSTVVRFDLLYGLHKGLPDLNTPTLLPPLTVKPVPRQRHKLATIFNQEDDDDDDDSRHSHHDDDDDDDADDQSRRSQSPPKFSGSADLLRLNTDIPPTPLAEQDSMAILAGQLDGFPNGRRIGDDVVDIYLRIAEGQLCSTAFLDFVNASAATLPNLNATLQDNCFLLYGANATIETPAPTSFSLSYTDRSPTVPTSFNASFPFLNPPIQGSGIIECWKAISPRQNNFTDGGREFCAPNATADPLLAPLRQPSCQSNT